VRYSRLWLLRVLFHGLLLCVVWRFGVAYGLLLQTRIVAKQARVKRRPWRWRSCFALKCQYKSTEPKITEDCILHWYIYIYKLIWNCIQHPVRIRLLTGQWYQVNGYQVLNYQKRDACVNCNCSDTQTTLCVSRVHSVYTATRFGHLQVDAIYIYICPWTAVVCCCPKLSQGEFPNSPSIWRLILILQLKDLHMLHNYLITISTKTEIWNCQLCLDLPGKWYSSRSGSILWSL
jgi:hypothetical protein